jgi:uncharacterized protein
MSNIGLRLSVLTSVPIIVSAAAPTALVVALTRTATPVDAQRWSCSAPRTSAERVIGDSPQLHRLDERMANGCNTNCLVTYYEERIDAFRNVLGR